MPQWEAFTNARPLHQPRRTARADRGGAAPDRAGSQELAVATCSDASDYSYPTTRCGDGQSDGSGPEGNDEDGLACRRDGKGRRFSGDSDGGGYLPMALESASNHSHDASGVGPPSWTRVDWAEERGASDVEGRVGAGGRRHLRFPRRRLPGGRMRCGPYGCSRAAVLCLRPPWRGGSGTDLWGLRDVAYGGTAGGAVDACSGHSDADDVKWGGYDLGVGTTDGEGTSEVGDREGHHFPDWPATIPFYVLLIGFLFAWALRRFDVAHIECVDGTERRAACSSLSGCRMRRGAMEPCGAGANSGAGNGNELQERTIAWEAVRIAGRRYARPRARRLRRRRRRDRRRIVWRGTAVGDKSDGYPQSGHRHRPGKCTCAARGSHAAEQGRGGSHRRFSGASRVGKRWLTVLFFLASLASRHSFGHGGGSGPGRRRAAEGPLDGGGISGWRTAPRSQGPDGFGGGGDRDIDWGTRGRFLLPEARSCPSYHEASVWGNVFLDQRAWYDGGQPRREGGADVFPDDEPGLRRRHFDETPAWEARGGGECPTRWADPMDRDDMEPSSPSAARRGATRSGDDGHRHGMLPCHRCSKRVCGGCGTITELAWEARVGLAEPSGRFSHHDAGRLVSCHPFQGVVCTVQMHHSCEEDLAVLGCWRRNRRRSATTGRVGDGHPSGGEAGRVGDADWDLGLGTCGRFLASGAGGYGRSGWCFDPTAMDTPQDDLCWPHGDAEADGVRHLRRQCGGGRGWRTCAPGHRDLLALPRGGDGSDGGHWDDGGVSGSGGSSRGRGRPDRRRRDAEAALSHEAGGDGLCPNRRADPKDGSGLEPWTSLLAHGGATRSCNDGHRYRMLPCHRRSKRVGGGCGTITELAGEARVGVAEPSGRFSCHDAGRLVSCHPFPGVGCTVQMHHSCDEGLAALGSLRRNRRRSATTGRVDDGCRRNCGSDDERGRGFQGEGSRRGLNAAGPLSEEDGGVRMRSHRFLFGDRAQGPLANGLVGVTDSRRVAFCGLRLFSHDVIPSACADFSQYVLLAVQRRLARGGTIWRIDNGFTNGSQAPTADQIACVLELAMGSARGQGFAVEVAIGGLGNEADLASARDAYGDLSRRPRARMTYGEAARRYDSCSSRRSIVSARSRGVGIGMWEVAEEVTLGRSRQGGETAHGIGDDYGGRRGAAGSTWTSGTPAATTPPSSPFGSPRSCSSRTTPSSMGASQGRRAARAVSQCTRTRSTSVPPGVGSDDPTSLGGRAWPCDACKSGVAKGLLVPKCGGGASPPPPSGCRSTCTASPSSTPSPFSSRCPAPLCGVPWPTSGRWTWAAATTCEPVAGLRAVRPRRTTGE